MRTPLALAVCGEGAEPTPAVERRFFERLPLPNGTWKTTYRGRLDDLNELLLEQLPRDRPLRLLDVGVSSAISTAEWSGQLEAAGVEHAVVGTDLVLEARLTSCGEWFSLLCLTSNHEPVLVEVGSISLPLYSARRSVRVLRPALASLLRRLDSFARGGSPGRGRGRLLRWREVPLVAPEVRRRARIELVEADVTRPWSGGAEFDAIRAANLVQRSYFGDETLRLILSNLRGRLRPGGLLALCQTLDDRNHATVFRLAGDHFEAIASLGDGVGVGDLVLDL